MCHKFNDQMLMLTCVHDPCISCAATYYLEEARGKTNYYVMLPSCSSTPVDSATLRLP